DEFLFGASLLVAPVLLEGARERRLYLPEGEWYDYWTGTRVSGGREITVPVVLESIPLFVRAGGIIFGWPVLQNTEERVGKPLIVTLYPSPRSEAELYEDDGEGFGYQHGVFLRRLFAQDRSPGACTIHVGAAQGTYRPASRDLILHLRGCGEAVRVAVDGKELLRLATEGLDPTERGWTRRGDDLVVRVADRWDAFTITAPEPPRTGAGGSRTGPDDVLHPAISP
ncbi:MAG TPA: DUF5110 domain-containing protein, partial [Vicinamibacteria bacterium]|nr:DUF5110 domain-containing protein [Vicinamibacteria bacterium]